jgi:hypothetical protein
MQPISSGVSPMAGITAEERVLFPEMVAAVCRKMEAPSP